MKIKFCGGVQSVTGSCHLITIGDKKLLLDCGQFQGNKTTEKLNYEDFPFDPSEIDFMILSHAHVDHCGRIPLLVKRGFSGKIFCTDATYDLVQIMLLDSAHIQEKETEWQNRKNMRAGRPPVEPLYTIKDAEASFKYFEPVMYDETKQLCDEIKIKFNDAGHILGSAIIEIWAIEDGKKTKIVFSGDLGMKHRPILRDPVTIREADIVIMETTYGNRVHTENSESIDQLINIIIETAARGGNVVIPAFAVGRTQELLYDLNRFYEKTSPDYKAVLDNIKVYVDSPMAINATDIFKRNAQVFDEETKEYILKGDHPLEFPNLVFTKTSEESQAINFDPTPKVIMSASGMCNAGRIKHHLKHNIWSEKNSIVFVGYQAEGTLGKRIIDGEKHISLFGEEIYVNAHIYNLEGMSGHADRTSLLDWLGGFDKKPSQIFLVHGEHDSKHDFADSVKAVLGYDAIPIDDISEYELVTASDQSVQEIPVDVSGESSAKPEEQQASRDEVIAIREKMYQLHEDFEKLLYNASLAVDGTRVSSQKAEDINKILLSLQKGIVNLGADISE